MTPRETPAPPRGWWLVAAAFALVAVVNVVPRVGYWSGDSVIHLVIAERIVQGRWFQYNLGEVSSGSTSFGWNLFEAALIALGGMGLVAWAVPLFLVAVLAGVVALVYRLARRQGCGPAASALGALSLVAVPGVTYNAVLGMENPVFALVALAFLLAWHARARGPTPAAVLALAPLWALAILLRPEGVLLGVVFLVPTDARAGLAGVARGVPRAVLVGAVAVALIAPVLWLHWRYTGRWAPGSGVSRMMLARRMPTSVHVAGPLWLYAAVPARLVVYFPLTALAALGATDPAAEGSSRALRRAVAACALAGVALYTVGTGAAHVARYMEWLFALLAALAPGGVERVVRAWPARRAGAALGALGLAFLVVGAGETVARFRDRTQRHGGYPASWIAAAPATRRAETDRWLAVMCAGGCCRPGVTPRIATTEVEVRFFLDERFAISSMDGRTSGQGTAREVRFTPDGCVNMEAVVDDPRVVAFTSPPLSFFERCAAPAAVRRLHDAWKRPETVPPGWRWNAQPEAFVRVCDAPATARLRQRPLVVSR